MTQTIVSIWPFELKESRPRFHPQSEFVVPAAQFDGIAILKIDDVQEGDYLAAGKSIMQVVTAESLAEDLVRSWRQWTVRGGHRGVWIHPKAEATVEEIMASPEYAAARREQDELMKNLVVQARELYNQNFNTSITNNHRMAAQYLRIEGEAWLGSNVGRDQKKTCQFCGQLISKTAVTCFTCKEIVDPAGYAALKRDVANQIAAEEQQTVVRDIPDNGGSALRPAPRRTAAPMAG
jgi:hypothetical protein